MNDEAIAKNKTSMKIKDGQLVSWGTVKGTILNYIKKYLASSIPNTKSILTKLENEYSLSGQNQSDVFQYRNSVSGLINKISGKAQDWPSSSVFSYIKGNKVTLITLAGVIEYDKNDVKQTPSGEAYINNAKAHFFNGADVNISICPSIDSGLTYEQLENGDFNGDDIRLFPSIPENVQIDDINDIKDTTTYEVSYKDSNNSNQCYYLSLNSRDGISVSNLSDNNVVSGVLSYKNNVATNQKIEVCSGKFANFMPYMDVNVGYLEINGDKNTQNFQADGCGGICKDDLSAVNLDYIVNDFVHIMSNNDSINDGSISEISNKFRSLLTNIQKANIDENDHDNETGDRYSIINLYEENKDKCYFKIRTLFNGKNVDQIIKYDKNGNYLIAETNLKRSASDDIYEVQLGNGDLFIGKLKSNEITGDVWFMEGKFLNREGKVIDNKKQISLQEASSLSFTGARNINKNDVKEFQDSSRVVIEKGENGYDFTIIGTSFENTIKNDKVFRNYLPTLEYINKQIEDVEKFLTSEMQECNHTSDETYKECIEKKNKQGFSNRLIEDIRKRTKELYAKTKENTYVLSNGEKLTQGKLSTLYAQLSQWQYLYRMRCKLQELDGNSIEHDKPVNQEMADDKSNNKIDPALEKNHTKSINDIKQEEVKKENKKTDIGNNNNVDNKIIRPKNENLLQQSRNDNEINNGRYPKILNHNDLTAILKDPEAEQLAGQSKENEAIFSNIMTNVVDTEDDKIKLFIKTCQLIHESRGKICENGAKILPLSQAEYEEFMQLNNRLTDSMKYARDKELYKQVQSYHIEITDEYNDIKDDFNKSMRFALSNEERLNKALHAKNCKLLDELDRTREIKRCCNDILYERDVNGENINKKHSGYYNAYENKDSLNEASGFNLDATPYNAVDSSII